MGFVGGFVLAEFVLRFLAARSQLRSLTSPSELIARNSAFHSIFLFLLAFDFDCSVGMENCAHKSNQKAQSFVTGALGCEINSISASRSDRRTHETCTRRVLLSDRIQRRRPHLYVFRTARETLVGAAHETFSAARTLRIENGF